MGRKRREEGLDYFCVLNYRVWVFRLVVLYFVILVCYVPLCCVVLHFYLPFHVIVLTCHVLTCVVRHRQWRWGPGSRKCACKNTNLWEDVLCCLVLPSCLPLTLYFVVLYCLMLCGVVLVLFSSPLRRLWWWHVRGCNAQYHGMVLFFCLLSCLILCLVMYLTAFSLYYRKQRERGKHRCPQKMERGKGKVRCLLCLSLMSH